MSMVSSLVCLWISVFQLMRFSLVKALEEFVGFANNTPKHLRILKCICGNTSVSTELAEILLYMALWKSGGPLMVLIVHCITKVFTDLFNRKSLIWGLSVISRDKAYGFSVAVVTQHGFSFLHLEKSSNCTVFTNK